MRLLKPETASEYAYFLFSGKGLGLQLGQDQGVFKSGRQGCGRKH